VSARLSHAQCRDHIPLVKDIGRLIYWHRRSGVDLRELSVPNPTLRGVADEMTRMGLDHGDALNG
jgi:hypothetical protein